MPTMKYVNSLFVLFAIVIASLFVSNVAFGQSVGIGPTSFTPDVNAILDVQSDTRGVLLPRSTTDPVVANSNNDGLMYFNTSDQTYRYYDESADQWKVFLAIPFGATSFYINNQTSVQSSANFNIDGAGVIGTTATVGSTLAVGSGIRVGNGTLAAPLPGAGNIEMTVDDSWIGTSDADISRTARIKFDKTAGSEGITLAVNKPSISTLGYTAVTIRNEGVSSGVGLKLSGQRGLGTAEASFIDFENIDGANTSTLTRLGVHNANSSNTQGAFHISVQSTGTVAAGQLEERFVLDHLGNLVIDGKFTSNGIKETSDGRFKKNIEGISNALANVLSLEGVTYNWRTEEFPSKSFTDRVEYGVIAQQVEKIIPELVDTDKDGYKSVQYSHMVPLLIEAIKEQQAIINAQSQEIGVLKASVDAISEHIKTAEK